MYILEFVLFSLGTFKAIGTQSCFGSYDSFTWNAIFAQAYVPEYKLLMQRRAGKENFK